MSKGTTIPIRNAWYLLLYAWDLGEFGARYDGLVEQSPSLLGLLARVLADVTRRLLQRSMGRAFTTTHETIDGVRGRIDFARSLKRLDFEAGRAHCHFSTLDVDTLGNRVLRSTLDRLSGDSRVDHADKKVGDDLRQTLRGLVRAMEGVTLVPVTNALFSQLQLGRSDREYALPLAICRLVHSLALPTEVAGDHALVALMRDEMHFWLVFQRFVHNFWRYHRTDYHVKSESLDWHDELGSRLVPRMYTDITLTHRTTAHRLVVDTKFYSHTLTEGQHGRAGFNSGHLYQIYAYLRTQEHLGPTFRDADGMLLYPTTDAEVDDAMRVQGHRIRVVTVDLNRPWEEIAARLTALPS